MITSYVITSTANIPGMTILHYQLQFFFLNLASSTCDCNCTQLCIRHRREYVASWLLDHAWFSHLLWTHWLCIVIILIVVQITVEREATIDSDVRLRRQISTSWQYYPTKYKMHYLHFRLHAKTFFYLGRFLKKLADNQYSSITKGYNICPYNLLLWVWFDSTSDV